MVLEIDDTKRIICTMCKKVAITLIPLYDKDHTHKSTMCCRACKKHIRSGNPAPIIQFKRNAELYNKIEAEYNRKLGKRQVVERI